MFPPVDAALTLGCVPRYSAASPISNDDSMRLDRLRCCGSSANYLQNGAYSLNKQPYWTPPPPRPQKRPPPLYCSVNRAAAPRWDTVGCRHVTMTTYWMTGELPSAGQNRALIAHVVIKRDPSRCQPTKNIRPNGEE